jgi:hypothetical protein
MPFDEEETCGGFRQPNDVGARKSDVESTALVESKDAATGARTTQGRLVGASLLWAREVRHIEFEITGGSPEPG